MKRFLILVSALALSFVSLAVPVSAITVAPSISIDDETPVADQRVYLFMEDLEPNTEYSYGYMFAVGDNELPYAPDWVPHFGLLGNFTTDSDGSAIENFDWYWQANEEYDVYSGVFPTYIFVSESGVTPTSTTDVIAKTNIIYPGQNLNLGTVSITGPGVGGNEFIAGSEITVSFDGFSSDYDQFETLILADSEYEKATDIWSIFFSDLQEQNWFLMNGFDDFGDSIISGTIPDIGTSSHLLFQLFNDDPNDHSATWFVTDIHGNIEPFVDLQGVYQVPNSVRPYTYFEAYDENLHSDYYLNVDSELSCSVIGGFILFYAPGTCDWTITNESEEVLFDGSVVVSKTADINAATPLDHKSLTFKKGSIALSKANAKLIRKISRDYVDQTVLLNGYAWKEGTAKKMNKLSRQRGLRVSDYFDLQEMSTWLVVGFGNQKPLYKTGSKQILNRRVEVIIIPSDVL